MSSPKHIRILLVDDLEFMRSLLKEVLEPEGFSICGEATNGREAILLYQKLNPDLVLLDITMPELDGVSALKKIHSIDKNAKVIMCSAISEKEMIEESISHGALDYIVKPFRPQRVVRAVKRALGFEVV